MELRLNAVVGSLHPECGPSEFFVGYCNLGGFQEIEFRTKRKGTLVVDDDGIDVTNEAREGSLGIIIFPVFAETSERLQ